MDQAVRKQSGRGAIGRLLVLLAALAGLFAMHGLADHGTGGAAAVASTSVAGHVEMDHPSAAHDGHAAQGAVQGAGPQAPAHEHSMEMAGLCLAVLVALLTLAAAAWRRPTHRLTAWLAALPARRRTPAAWRPAGPPGRFALSILRC